MAEDKPAVRDRLVPILYLVRGLPGSGKTTYANNIGCIVIAPSDMMSKRGGEYQWVRGNYMISKMHFREIVKSLMALQIDICITEIMPEKKFIEFWLDIAREYYYEVQIKTLLVTPEVSIERNVHHADHKSVYEIHEQFDYNIIDQTLDYSNGGKHYDHFIQTSYLLGCASRCLLNTTYPWCNTVDEVLNDEKFRLDWRRLVYERGVP